MLHTAAARLQCPTMLTCVAVVTAGECWQVDPTCHSSAVLLAAAAVFDRVEVPLSAQVFALAMQAAVVAAKQGEVAAL